MDIKNTILPVYFAILGLGLQSVSSQFPTGFGWVMPRASQKATVVQTLGVTEIEVRYSRPLVNQRAVWGEEGIVPYDNVWRAGANEATTVSFGTDVTIMGNELKKGTYSFFLLPRLDLPWVAIFNGEPDQWGAFQYDETKDAARIEVNAEEARHKEALEFSFPEISRDTAFLEVHWERKKVVLPISVNLEELTKEKADTSFDWPAGYFAATYFFERTKDIEEALKWVNASIALNQNTSNLDLKSRILEEQENYADAIGELRKILALSGENPRTDTTEFRQGINGRIGELRKKMEGRE